MTLYDMLLPYQKAVADDSSSVKVLNFSRQIGKTHTCGYLASKKCLEKDGALVVYLSTGQRAADEALRTCKKFAEAISVLTDGKISYSSNASCITFSNGSRIMSLPGNPSSCRGWTVDLLVCDEVAFWQQPEETWQAIAPTLLNKLAGGDKQVLISSTPLAKNSIFFDFCQRAKSEPGWKYFQTTIEDAVKQGLKADIDQLHQLIPDPNQFQQEFMCQFANSSSQLIDQTLLQHFTDQSQLKFVDYFIGADWARTSDGTSIAVLGRTKDGKIYLIDLVNMHNVEYSKQIAVATEIFRKYNPVAFYADNGGLGSPLCEQLNRNVSTRIKGFNFTAVSKPAAYEYFRKQVFDRKLFIKEEFRNMIADDLSLIQQVISENGKTTYVARRFNGSHADNISALILALQAERENPTPSGALPTAFTFNSAFGSWQSRM